MKLMIVDDNAGMRQSIRQAVAAPGDVVCECASGDEAVRTALQFKLDAVAMDGECPAPPALTLRAPSWPHNPPSAS